MPDVTTILEKLNSGQDPHAAEELLSAVYKELHIMAQSKMNGEKAGHTLQPTILVDDAWLKLFPDGKRPQFENRAHFFGATANAMRRILVDHARRRNALKRGEREEMSETKFAKLASPSRDELTLAVDEALECFAKNNEDTDRLIELRFFAGLSMKEAAGALGISLRSAERDYASFVAWFRGEYGKQFSFKKVQIQPTGQL